MAFLLDILNKPESIFIDLGGSIIIELKPTDGIYIDQFGRKCIHIDKSVDLSDEYKDEIRNEVREEEMDKIREKVEEDVKQATKSIDALSKAKVEHEKALGFLSTMKDQLDEYISK